MSKTDIDQYWLDQNEFLRLFEVGLQKVYADELLRVPFAPPPFDAIDDDDEWPEQTGECPGR